MRRRRRGEFERAGSALYAAAARRRLGQLLGGTQGAALVGEAGARLRGRGVVDPAKLAGALVL